MKTIKRRKSVILALAAVMAIVIAVTGSTFAWFTATDARDNHFETAKITSGTATIFEVFKSPDEWMPDQDIIKEVGAVNSGASPILVRISFEEYLDKLTSDAKKFTTPLSGDQVPVIFDDSEFTKPTSDWEVFPGTTGLHLSAAAIAALGSTGEVLVIEQTNATGDKAYGFVVYANVAYGDTSPKPIVKQAAIGDFTVDADAKEVNVSNLQYFAFDKREQKSLAWADLTDPQILTYTDGIVDFATPIGGGAAKTLYSQLDANPLKQNIQLKYSTDVVNTTPTTGKWFFNEDDGFFYFIAYLEPGQISPLLLTSVYLDKDAGGEYSSMIYDLYVNMEAVQPLESAVDALWDIKSTSTGTSLLVYNALKPLFVVL